jgi:hypothetical protein
MLLLRSIVVELKTSDLLKIILELYNVWEKPVSDILASDLDL